MKVLNSHCKKPWLITFSDLIMLLITFYVLFFALSSTGVKELKELVGSMPSGGEGFGKKSYGRKSFFEKSGEFPESLEPVKSSAILDRIASFGEGKKAVDLISGEIGYLVKIPTEKVLSDEGIILAIKEILKEHNMEVKIRVYSRSRIKAVEMAGIIARKMINLKIDPERIGIIGYKGKSSYVEFFLIPFGGAIYG